MENGQWRRVGLRIRELRKQRKITQVELAERLHTTQPTLSDYERGELKIDADMLGMFAEALGVPVRALVEDTDPLEIDRHELLQRITEFFSRPHVPDIDLGKDNVKHNRSGQLVAVGAI